LRNSQILTATNLNSSQPDSDWYPLAWVAAAQTDFAFFIAREGRGLVAIASERSCSVTMSDHRVVSHIFVIKLDRASATRPALDKGAVLMH